ncbi:jg12337 [Pararge aegeria aegeria]|uniref:Jg12337 protein n=1 Tax=Pararge aegeria aegeria TaxID=348720 RepID=A0A8S4R8F4_9NEOP|nr:jg12337 [Pararge aegeria aegeria]
MKLIILKTLLIYLAATVCGQKFQQDQFPFPPQFQTPSSAFTSDSSIYLQPESHTPVPYFSVNNLNKLPFQFLPPTGTKAPSMFSTPLPMYLSTMRFDDDENDENNHDDKRNTQATTPNRNPQSYSIHANNNTVKHVLERKDNIFSARMTNQQPQIHQTNQFIPSKFEVQPPSYVTIGPKERAQTNPQNPAARRMIVTSEIQRADQSPDQTKASSYQTSQYIQAPGVFISSTTEPAIPILRLSNEMDLDGSFSYEALGADQTHYVQHSRMENMGSDKEEQVVEGSYSYIGDDGRTYTVHYIADSNGFRATGDHLPVPPPVPEIIQRTLMKKENSGVHPEIISRQNFIPPSQTATQSYTIDDASFEPSKITIPNGNTAVNLQTKQKPSENGQQPDYYGRITTLEPLSKTTTNYQYINTENSSFRPIRYNSGIEIKQETTTTEVPMSKMIRENIFLRNFLKPQNNEENATKKPVVENIKQINNEHTEYHEIKSDKESNYFEKQENTQNEIKIKPKPLEIDNILNFVVLKNHFESIKTKPKNKPVQHYIQNTLVKDKPTQYIPIKESTSYYLEPNTDDIQKQDNDFRTLNHQQQQELQGLIKNYKVLQRHKSANQRSQPLPEPQRHIKAFHTQHLPPLGRAGPSMKSYLPPTYL